MIGGPASLRSFPNKFTLSPQNNEAPIHPYIGAKTPQTIVKLNGVCTNDSLLPRLNEFDEKLERILFLSITWLVRHFSLITKI